MLLPYLQMLTPATSMLPVDCKAWALILQQQPSSAISWSTTDPYSHHIKQKTRRGTLQGAGTLQDLLKALIHDHPNKAFLVYLEYSMGKDLDTFQAALPQLQSVVQQPGWHQHVLQRVKTAGIPVWQTVTA